MECNFKKRTMKYLDINICQLKAHDGSCDGEDYCIFHYKFWSCPAPTNHEEERLKNGS